MDEPMPTMRPMRKLLFCLVLPARGCGSMTVPIADPDWADDALVTFSEVPPQAPQ
jgi:hypothetical protein